MSLNPDQKRFLAATLIELEEHLLRFETLLQQDETVTIFRKITNPFPKEQRAKLLSLIAALKKLLTTLRDVLGLPVEKVDLQWQMIVTLLHLAVNLTECEPSRLGAFGEIETPTAQVLTRFLRRLTSLLEQLGQEAKG